MKGNLNMDNNQILNLPAPAGPKQPTPLAFSDMKYLHVAGTNKMTNNLNMDNKKIINLRPPTDSTDGVTKKYVDDTIPDTSSFIKKDGSVVMTNNLNLGNRKIVGLATPTTNTDAANKKYVDDNTAAPDLSDYLEKDGTVTMTGNLNVGNNKIINLSKPTQDNDAATKNYVDKLVHHTAVQPSHYKDEFSYLMSSGAQWTDETGGGTSFSIDKIDDLPPNKGNFHDYNHKVIYMSIYNKTGYKFKMGMNFYRLPTNTDFTLCLEILNTDYILWNRTQISVDKGTSKGLTIGNVTIKNFSHSYTDSRGKTATIYYHRIIVNFRKLSSGNRFFLHILVNIPLSSVVHYRFPYKFSGVYMIAYGIVGTFSNIDPDKVYDYHTAFDIKPTEVVYNVDINANNKKILNINLDRNTANSAATVGMVKELAPYTVNNLYREYFEEVFDFSDANNYKLNKTSSGIVFNYLKSITGNTARDMGIPNRTLDDIRKEGLNIKNYKVSFSPTAGIQKYTFCVIFYHWRNRDFRLTKEDSSGGRLINMYYNKTNNKVTLTVNNKNSEIPMLSEFSGKKIVLWLIEDRNQNVTKVKISSYNSILSLPVVRYTNDQGFVFMTQDGIIDKIMFSPNFYDTDSVEYHKIILQEKINGSYIE